MTTRVPGRGIVRPVPAKAQPMCGSVGAFVRVRLAPYLSREVFEAHLRTIPAVSSALHVIGDVDYEVRLACRDLADLEAVLASLRRCRGTEVASTALVLGEVAGLGRQAARPGLGPRAARPGRQAAGLGPRARSIPDWGTVPRPRHTRSA
jgi:hypothetical protein